MLKKNVGTVDRAIRVIVGLALILGFFMTTGPYSWLYLVGIIPLVTGLLGTCGLYSLLGISTCPMDKR